MGFVVRVLNGHRAHTHTQFRGVQNRLTKVSVNRKSVNRFFGSKEFQTVTEPKISVNRVSVRPKPEPKKSVNQFFGSVNRLFGSVTG